MQDNVIIAAVQRNHLVTVDHRYQYDYGQVLYFEGIDLPETFEAHFSNGLEGETVTQIGSNHAVPIPNSVFQSGQPVFAWVFVHDGLTDGRTKYVVKIPVRPRPEISDETPTPEEQSAITQAIAALNEAVEKCEAAVDHAPKIENGTWWVWNADTGAFEDTGESAQGEQGDPGDPGEPGYSPTVEITDTEDGHIINITDAFGVHSYQVYDGKDASEAAEAAAEEAENWAQEAKMSAAAAGYFDVEIVDGNLIYTRVGKLDVDFALINGHLVMTEVD